jgi:hypothetical protein
VREGGHSPPYFAEVKNGAGVPQLYICLHLDFHLSRLDIFIATLRYEQLEYT